MGKRSAFDRIARDYYRTPLKAVLPLIPHLPYGTMFAEPCAGDGALVGHLEAHGMSCNEATDIAPQEAWIDRLDALDWLADPSTDMVITNPPWARPTLHAMIPYFAVQRPTWLLFDADWLHTQQSRPFLPLLRKVVSVGRVRWIEGSAMDGKDNCCWFHFAPGNAPTEFVGRAA